MLLSDFKASFLMNLQEIYPRKEVESFFFMLSEAYLGKTRLELALSPMCEISSKELQQFKTAMERLQEHEPVQYIIGKTEFFGLEFMVDERVLIPRPETEELVQWILEDLAQKDRQEMRIIDLGTGSGCIAIALARNLPQAQVTGIDFSGKALEIARENAYRNQVDVSFQQQDVLEMEAFDKKFDVVVSNPPYVRELERAQMHQNVLDYEPSEALYVSDANPLVYYEKICSLANRGLREEGAVYFEINQYLAAESQALLMNKKFRTWMKEDIFGVPRMLKGKQV